MTSAVERKNKLAKVARVVTIPPMLIATLLFLIYFLRDGVFYSPFELIACITFLAVVPALAYPLQPYVPKFRDMDKRQGQRKLAFITSPIGYTLGFSYALITDASSGLKFIFTGYLLSVVMLLVFNKIIKIHASGHACGVLGPLLYAVYFLGDAWVIPCAILCALVVWSSLRLARHTPRELLLGGLCALTSFCIGMLCI